MFDRKDLQMALSLANDFNVSSEDRNKMSKMVKEMVIDFEETLDDKEYNNLQDAFKDHLYDMGYGRDVIEFGDCKDGYFEFVAEDILAR